MHVINTQAAGISVYRIVPTEAKLDYNKDCGRYYSIHFQRHRVTQAVFTFKKIFKDPFIHPSLSLTLKGLFAIISLTEQSKQVFPCAFSLLTFTQSLQNFMYVRSGESSEEAMMTEGCS